MAVRVDDDARETFARLAEESPDPRVRLRAGIILRASEGLSNVAIAKIFDVNPCFVSRTRQAYATHGLEALLEGSRRAAASAVVLDDATRRELKRREQSIDPRVRTRAEIVLEAAGGMPNYKIAQELGIKGETVRLWRDRFARHGLDGLVDRPRPKPAKVRP